MPVMNWNKLLSVLLITVTGLLVINFALLLYSFKLLKKSKQTQQFAEEIVYNFNDIWDQLKSSDLGVRSFLLTDNEDMLTPHLVAKPAIDQQFAVLDSLLLINGNYHEDFIKYRDRFLAKIQESDQIIDLIRNGNKNDALAIFNQDSGYDLYLNYYAPLQEKLITYQNQIIKKASSRYLNFLQFIKFSSIILILLSLPVLIFVLTLFKRQNKKRVSLYRNLHLSNKRYIFNNGDDENKDDEDVAIKDIVANLEKSSRFIDNITNGEYNVAWEGMTDDLLKLNQNNLAGNLIKMRDKMKNAKNDDKIRIWFTEGHSKFASITRKHVDEQEMYNEFIIELVKYLNMHLGMLFVKKEDEDKNIEDKVTLRLEVSYAFGRKKYLEKELLPGQGLAGQVFVEGKSTYLKKVPKDYLTIKSGMGESKPKAVLIVPVKHNDVTVGVLEMASFQPLENHQIGFVEDISTILASAIVNIQSSVVTRDLLKTTQEQAETLRMQEEEMRQNMEELEATQEEMRRNQQELEKSNQQLLHEKAKLEEELSLKS
jgi:CHASE3 domain sensor protein